MNKNYNILKVRDKSDSYYTPIDTLFDLPFRILINGKSQMSGKPDENRMEYNEDYLEILYDQLEDEFIEETMDGGKPENRLLIFDDCGYSGSLKNKQAGIISKLICNGRHLNLSQIYTSQRFSQCSTVLRTNITGAILFNTSMKELDLISEDMNFMSNNKDFVKMFRKTTEEPRSFLVVNFTNGKEGLYMDSEFKPIQWV